MSTSAVAFAASAQGADDAAAVEVRKLTGAVDDAARAAAAASAISSEACPAWLAQHSRLRVAVAALVALAVLVCVIAIASASSGRGGGGGGGGGSGSGGGPQQIALAQMANPCNAAAAARGCLATLAVTWVIPYGSSYALLTPPKTSTAGWLPLTAVSGGRAAVKPRVEYGSAAPLPLSGAANVSGYAYAGGTDWRGATSDYLSPTIFNAEIHLPPGAQFVYRVGDDANGFSPLLTAVMPPAVGVGPNLLAWAGDLGQSGNTSLNLDRILATHAQTPVQAFLHAGDASYADGEGPAWDSWGVLMQKVSAVIPFNTAVGSEWGSWPPARATSSICRHTGACFCCCRCCAALLPPPPPSPHLLASLRRSRGALERRTIQHLCDVHGALPRAALCRR